MNTKVKFHVLSLALILLMSPACKKKTENSQGTLQKLYTTYHNGEIDECTLDGKAVYCAGANVVDGEATIYNSAGVAIGSCNYAWGQPDSICYELENCQVVYRCKNHISGEPAIDKYGLGN